MDAPVLFDTWSAVGKQRIGVVTLNRPRSLNGLTLEICQEISLRLKQWENDRSIAFVVFKGAGEKAFCAGGDVRKLYDSVLANVSGHPWDNAYARQFFEAEYRLDYAIHTYAKPVLCWGSGIVMGGGVGLMMGASHRVVGETTRFAMPEITIGMFPDVAGTWMLGHLPAGIGMFLALTGAQLGASDCQFLGLADYFVESAKWDDLKQALVTQAWSEVRSENDIRLHQALRALEPGSVALSGPLQTHFALVADRCSGPDFDAICANLLALADFENAWVRQAAQTFKHGSPGSARLSFTLLRSVRALSLADVFRREYMAVLQCMAMGDFQEGVRALLVDKDKSPRWNPSSLACASQEWVRRYFVQPWPEGTPHPLADLGR